MKILSIDIETTGVIPSVNEILSIGIGCMDFSKDSTIPNTEQCMSRLGIIVNENIRHHSMYDAYLMTQAFAKLNNLKCFTLDDEIFKDKVVNLIEDN